MFGSNNWWKWITAPVVINFEVRILVVRSRRGCTQIFLCNRTVAWMVVSSWWVVIFSCGIGNYYFIFILSLELVLFSVKDKISWLRMDIIPWREETPLNFYTTKHVAVYAMVKWYQLIIIKYSDVPVNVMLLWSKGK